MSEIVRKYYDENAEQEWKRLQDPYSKIEFEGTMYLINKYFPKVGAVCDIGAGPGRYSIELIKKGYNTTLLEFSNKELEIAKEKIQELDLVAEAFHCRDARDLSVFTDNQFDALLVMGPLYHLINKEDRRKVLEESYRVLKPNGVAIIAYINSWGAIKAGISEFPESYSNIDALYKYLGEQSLSADVGFTECYFTTPPKALEEVADAGFDIVSYAGVEGFAAGFSNEIIKLYNENPEAYMNIVKASAENCESPQFRDATEHLHIVVHKNRK
ncbi:class I SAM-dependent methyltransferase [Alkaliphilus hydrothermalis]|uniref:Ubiquinone/menaquinone biosynthesis C-methylase UbiE n=1 Tax=Alkaliphilus hydrothermalis TaxID=1482730 RepID=A0ABS2NLI5_9FIRM|nr:class I SAM-dependent methyltransferase [Alkaliphilus hydrothermalis]MBM7613799.1 ubiquinone/menaquinone biosynthesis C-methylase UbiE [Alkaliphilus hydrothermalis]